MELQTSIYSKTPTTITISITRIAYAMIEDSMREKRSRASNDFVQKDAINDGLHT